jgi:hypothetical protein
MKAFKVLFILWSWVMLFASGPGSAAPIALLDLNFDAVPGLSSRTSVVSGEALLAWLPPGSAVGSPEGAVGSTSATMTMASTVRPPAKAPFVSTIFTLPETSW